MDLNKRYNLLKFNSLDLVKEYKYEEEIRRELYKKFSSDSIEDLKRKKRPFHFGAFFFE